eukprot:c55436_g1_i1.p1 GENE.c55436_g1_i1~~c55436_g1_i1.p1  ORF type:complete len:139 (+),score=25.54 c55436_g1_i1:348-764(+)
MPLKLVVLIKRKAGTTPEEFQRYYETHHSPLAHEIIGHTLMKYVRNFVTDFNTPNSKLYSADGEAEVKQADKLGFDCITEMWFEGQKQYDAFTAALTEEVEGEDRITTDEANFMDRENLRFFLVTEVESSSDSLMPKS